MTFLRRLLIISILSYLTNVNALLLINESGYTLSIYDFEEKLTDVKDCAEIKDELIANTEKLIVQVDQRNLFYTIVPCPSIPCGNSIIVFKNGGFKFFSSKSLKIEAKCENKELILNKIKEIEDNKLFPDPKDHPSKKCCSCCCDLPIKMDKFCNVM